MPSALILEDDPNSLTALGELVELEGFTVRKARSLAEARELAGSESPDLMLSDLVLPDGSGLDLLKEVRASSDSEVVLVTGHASVDTAVEALRMGASDYLTKPIDIARLKTVLANVARRRELREEIDNLRGELRKLGRFGSLIGASPQMSSVYDLIARVAPTDATVLITGESGTGKDVVAQTIHSLSRRRKGSYLPLNCGAVSPTLIETELFGHEKGSFTGADRTHRGHFERASGGTLFLDEITEMPTELQVKLLRVLETGAITRLGGEKSVEVDVRVIAATNRSAEQAVQEGTLREDLFYRLNVFPLRLPPLRDREGDIELLAAHFLNELNQGQRQPKSYTQAAIERLVAHRWPGNVRELRNVIQRAFILAESDIDAVCLPLEGPATVGSAAPPVQTDGRTLQIPVGLSVAEVERHLIVATLEEHSGDKQKAAEVLGISVKTLYNRLNAYKVQPGE
jgi:two-component system, NtrC family, response regulator HydG